MMALLTERQTFWAVRQTGGLSKRGKERVYVDTSRDVSRRGRDGFVSCG